MSGNSAQSGFEFNQPTIVALLYLGSFLTGISGLVGVVLAHVWKGENTANWAASHFTYLTRTFWIALAVSVVLFITVIGIPLLILPAVWLGVRSVMSLIKAQREEPMPDPNTLAF